MTQNRTFPKIFIAFALLLGSTLYLSGQDDSVVGSNDPKIDRPDEERPNLIRELGLSPEQIKQIRKMNMERRPIERDARRRFREARQNLDAAVYGESLNERDVMMRLEEFQLAQGEMVKMRTINELSVRKILRPQQLVKFRELRRNFAQTRENFPNRHMRNERRRLRRINRQTHTQNN